MRCSQSGLIVHSKSAWLSPMHLVSKPDGSIRITIDYRKLNAVTVKDAFPLPNIQHIFLQLTGARVFSKLDLSSGYYQIKMEPSSQQYTAFGCEFGLFEFTVMSMGLTNACATFQRMVHTIFLKEIGVFVIVYIDDILVFSKTIDEHLAHLSVVIGLLNKYGLKVKTSQVRVVPQQHQVPWSRSFPKARSSHAPRKPTLSFSTVYR